MRTEDIMTTDVAFCTPETRLPEVARMMAEHDCGAIPVVEDGDAGGGKKKVVGIVTDRDIACRAVAQGRDVREMTARDCMSPGVVTVPAGSSVEDCCKAMEEHQVRRVPVTDAGGGCCGIVAQADIARHAPERETAEVVKDVSQATGAPRRGCCG